MKSEKQIVDEIKSQIKALKKKKIKPELLLLGSLSYYTLKSNNFKDCEETPNSGKHLKRYMDLRIVHQPIYEAGGVFKAEHELVEVFGR